MRKTLYYIWESLRPRQWLKNLFIFAGIIFSKNIFNLSLLFKVIFSFFIFCVLSGAVYILNDLVDLEQDKYHPVKASRPLTSGKLKKSHALLALIILIAFSLGISYSLGLPFASIALAYLLLQSSYSFLLKRIIILDVFAIACGFLLRVIAGAVVINIEMSVWFLICSMFLALFLGLSKRRYELNTLKENASHHREVLSGYHPYLLDQMIIIIASATIVSYALYTMSAQTIRRFGSSNLIFTVPFVLFGILRYLYLVQKKQVGGYPENTLFEDSPLVINMLLWVITAAVIIYK